MADTPKRTLEMVKDALSPFPDDDVVGAAWRLRRDKEQAEAWAESAQAENTILLRERDEARKAIREALELLPGKELDWSNRVNVSLARSVLERSTKQEGKGNA